MRTRRRRHQLVGWFLSIGLAFAWTHSAAAAPVLPGDPGPSSMTYQFIFTHASGEPHRWNPCASHSYKVDPTGMDAETIDEIHHAMASTDAITGMTFSYAGTFVGNVGDPEERTIKFAIAPWGQGEGPAGRANPHSRGGVIYFSPVQFQDYLQDSVFLRQVLLHEVGHALGLAHIQNPAEIMHPQTQLGVDEFGPGDTFGLRHLGVEAGCIAPTPVPQPSPQPTPPRPPSNRLPVGGNLLSVVDQRNYGLFGFAYDPDSPGRPVRVRVVVDGVAVGDVRADFRWDGPPGFLYLRANMPSGTRNVCSFAFDNESGQSVRLGCIQIVVK